MSNSIYQTLNSVAQKAITSNQKQRDSRGVVSKSFDIATNKSFANEDKKAAAAALRQWENSTWKPKIAAKLQQELKKRAPHIKPGTAAYKKTYESLYNKNYQELQAAKTRTYQNLGTLRKQGQSQRKLDIESRQNDAIRNNTVGATAVAETIKDTASSVSGAFATGASRLVRAPLQLIADVGENDDGGFADRGAKALERHEARLKNTYEAYSDIQNNGSFSQKVALAGVEQIPSLAATGGVAGAAGKTALLLGAGARTSNLATYAATSAAILPQAYLDGSDSTKQELESATSQQLATAERSQDIYKGFFDKNIKAGMSEDEAFKKARDQTISQIAEDSGDTVGLATVAISMMAPGIGSQVATRLNGGALTNVGRTAFNRLAVRAESNAFNRVALPTLNVAQIGVRNAAEEALQEGFTDLTAQRAALDVGVRDKIDQEQLKEAALMGGVLGGIMGGGSVVSTRGSGFQQAQDNLRASQQQYAQGADQVVALQERIRAVSPRSPEGQELSAQLNELKANLNTMTEEAKARGIPRSSLARYAARIEPVNIDPEFDGNVGGSAELSDQEFEDILNGIDPNVDTSLSQDASPDTAEPQLSEQELDAQDEQLVQLIAEQNALDAAIEDGSNDKPLEESIAQASSWYDSKRGEGQQGLGGVVRRASAAESDAIDAQRPPVDITGAINSYVADQRAQQNSLDAELERDTAEATTLRQKKEAEMLAQQRERDRAESESMVAERVALAQPYENESFDATVIGADNVPFNLGRFWDSRMSAPMKAQAIAKAFGGEVDQNIAKADWQSMPEGVQKQLHGWMTSQLDALRQSQAVEQAATNATEEAVDVEVPTNPPPIAVNGLTMPTQQAPSATTKRRTPSAGTVAQQEESLKKINEELENYTPAATQLTDENPVINIPAPTQAKAETPAPTTDEGIYKSQPADSTAPNNDVAIGKDGQAKWFGSNDKAQAFIAKKGLSATHEVVEAGKSRFEIRPIDTTAPVNNSQVATTDVNQDTDNSTVYKSQPAARAAMKQQKLDPEKTSVVKVDGGWSLEAKEKPSAFLEAQKAIKRQRVVEEQEAKERRRVDAEQLKEETAPQTEVKAEKTQNDVSDTETKDRFADNKLFTSDKVAAARARLKAKMGQVNSGFDPEMAIDGMTLAGAYIESGVRKFGDYAKLMIDDFGDNIKPQLLSFWEGARNWQGLDTEGMTSVAESKREYDQLKAESEQASMPAEPLTLNQDWGVQKIDAYNVKTEFLKDAENYLNDVKDILKQKGYTSTVNNSGKPIKVVDTNQFGMQSSGAVQLTMQKDGVFVGVFIGNNDQTQNNSNHKQGIEIKVQSTPHEIWRLAQEFEWVDAKTTSQDLAKIIESHVAEKRKDKGANKSSTPAKPKYPQTVGSGPQMKTFVGENQSGLPLYENKSGVRAIEEYGIFNNETVSITPTGIEQQPREQRYLTKEELAAKEDKDNDTRTSNQDNQSRTDRGLLETEQADGSGRDAGRVQAEPTGRVDAVDGRSARSDTIESDGDTRSAATSQRADADDSNSGTSSAQSNDGAVEPANRQTLETKNFEIVPSIDNKQPSWQKVAERNVMIVELLKKLDEQGRVATPTEQAFLADYAGWGASEIANGIFPNPTTGEYKSNSWQALGEKLQSLLTDSEYATARQTTQYAHYTPPVLVKGIYAALEQFGFKGGQILEPASGVGVFNGLMPRGLASNSTYVGLELDPITGRIAQHLYPESNMKIADYIKAKLPDNHFDVAVGNPPFAGLTVSYKGTGKNVTKQALQLHDYFFAKTLDKLKPGGVMVFVTSKGTMDKTSSKTREYLAEQADLIGAIRLPQTAFKENAGTEVVTDIIFFRKRLEGEQPNDTAWTNVKTIQASGKPTTINEYFVNNPDMVLGEHAIVSGRFGDTYTVLPNKGNFESQVNDAIGKLPKDVFNPSRGSQAEAAKVQEVDYGPAANANKEGGVYLKDGQLMRVVDGVGSPLTQRYGTNGKPINLSAKDIAFMTDYVGVRDALKQAQRDQLNDSESWEDSLANLNSTYDAFVKKHGPLMAHSVSERENDDGTTTIIKRFRNKQRLFLDVEGVLASALENIVDDGKGTVVKGSFFEGRSLRKPKMPTINTTQDAMIYALDETGVLDIKRIASLTNLPESRVIEELGDQIYNDPNSKKWDLSESYLSGNVVEKLAQAQEAAKTDKSYNRNVKALTEVQPRPIAPNDISSNMGAAWIPGNVINEFNQEILGANITAEYSKTVGLWDVGGSSSSSDYSTADRSTLQLVESILNSRKISITRKSPDGSTYTDSVATELANEVARKIKTQFKNWLWSDETRTQELAEYYNKTYNNIVPPTFNGDHLTLAGMSNKIQLRSPQKQGIYRVIRQGDVYLNHAVGAGKTFTMIAAAMEEKRLGLINKPMFVVPNHMLDQFSQEFLMLYPAANIMVADEQNFNGQNRKQFVAQAALNTPDAIIITHSGFERIGVKPATKEKFLQEKLNSWQDSLESTKQDDGDNRTSVKQMERNIESITRRLDETLDAKEKDGAVFFEELGVDKLYIDEAHEFRKLDFVTKMGNIKGIDPAGSQRAMDLDMKLQLLRGTNPTRAFVGASGTPVTNTMGELYTIQRYFQPQQLEQEGLHHFDSWANQFGEVVEGLEQNAAGNYEVIPRFARFVNVPELMSRVRSFMDVLTSQDLGDFVTRPDVRTGGREIVAIPTPDGFSDYQASLAARIDAIRKRGGKAEKGDDIILSVIGDGRFSAIDMRFVDPNLPSDPNSKLNTVIRDMAEAYHATANNSYMTDGKEDGLKGGALMMFTDIGLGEQSAATRGFAMKDWINSELIRLGVKPEDIAFMRDNKTHAKKGKLFDDMRQGRKRIMIGGKDMETGVNAQKRLTHLFHLDAPWFPASVEQREGRIIRQGNQNKEVTIKAYATKGSYDSTMWSMVARKARFIEQAMRGDMTVRSMDDVSEASAFEQASALSSGDPRSMQLAGLRQDVERLNRQLSGYQNEKFGNQNKAKEARRTLARAERELDDVNKLLPTHKIIDTGDVIGKVGDKAFDNRADYGQAIINEFNQRASNYDVGEHVLGNAAGYNVVYNGVMMDGGNFYADANIDIPKSDDAALFDTDNAKDARPDGLTTRIINRVNKLADYKDKIEQIIEQSKTNAENFERRAGKSFDSQTELEEKSRELKELEDTLANEAEVLKANSNPNNFTDADRVPASDSPKFSRTNPAKGTTGTTSTEVINALQKHFGKPVVASLIKSGVLRVRTLNDFVDSDGNLTIPSDAEGFFHEGKAVLIADNLTSDTAIATLLHELGGHGGIQSMLSPSAYMSLMTNFDNLVKSGNKYAVRAKERADASTDSESEARDEYIPYLISEYSQATETTGAIGVIKRFVNRIVAAVRAWVRNNTGVDLKLTPNDITQLAERMIQRLSDQSASNITIAGIENMTASDMQFSQAPAPQSQVDAIRKQYENTDQWMKSPNGSDTNLTEQQWLQVRTPAFKEWFGDWEGDPDNASKILDENGEPLVLYHGSTQDFWAFDMSRSIKGRNNGMKGMFFSDNAKMAAGYSVDIMNDPDAVQARSRGSRDDVNKIKEKLFNQAQANPEQNTKAVFINSQAPFEQDMDGASFYGANKTAYDNYQTGKYDGIVNDNVVDDASSDFAQPPSKVVISFDATNIKSATDNIGTFDSSNPDIRYSKPQFSRRYSDLGQDTNPVTRKEKAIAVVKQGLATTFSSTYITSLILRRHLATPQHVALLNPDFKKFHDNVQARIAYENNEAGRIQSYLPEIWDTRLRIGKAKEALDKAGRAYFDGTMADKVWTSDELTDKFDLNDEQKDIYYRARQATDESLSNLVVDTISALGKGTKLVNIHTINKLKLEGLDPAAHMVKLQAGMVNELQKLSQAGSISAKAETRMQKQLDDVFETMDAIVNKLGNLIRNGYAPLMRFGHYAVEVRDKQTNALDLFELYESKGEQDKAIKDLKTRYDQNQFTVGRGVLNPEGFKQFTDKGLSPETVQLFAAELGLDTDGAMQAYLKIAVSDRSALKRLIHRKKVPGYSEDLPRVLSSFVMSNARYSGRSLYNGEIENAIQGIKDGHLQSESQNVFSNMENPQEEFAGTRSMMFHYFMGFSFAFLTLNLTQPLTQTIPKLTAYVGAARAHKDMAQALGVVSKYMGRATYEFGKKAIGKPTIDWKGFEDNLPAWVEKEDYLRMSREGHLDPQNIWMIRGLERGKDGVVSGAWGNVERMAGAPAEVSESINRRSTMIAAFRAAKRMGDAKLKAKGFNSAYDFAVSVIQQTQGIYNKGNRSGLARGNGKLGPYGPLVMVFKQFSINYVEQMIRHTKDGEYSSVAVAMGWQFMIAGMLGLPFTDDLRDIFEGFLYRFFGIAANLPDFLQQQLGKENADLLMYGLASEKTPFDMYGRSSMGNFIPGTNFARPQEGEIKEILGASSSFFQNFITGGEMMARGQYKDGLVLMSPRYIKDAANGIDIWNTGAYRNSRGDKIMDMSKSDALIKGVLQFNPSSNARAGRERSEAYHMNNPVKAKSSDFAVLLAAAMYQEDDDAIDELYNDMDAWNDRNADQYQIDIDKIEKSAEKRLEKKDFTSGDRQNLSDNLEEYLEDKAGT